MNHDEWTHQLAGIVDELGIHNPEIQICVYPNTRTTLRRRPFLQLALTIYMPPCRVSAMTSEEGFSGQ